MLRLSRFGLSLLLLNLTLVGPELACAHEAEALELSASVEHAGSQSHHEDAPSDPRDQPCDEPAAQCCDAIASCAVNGIPRQPLTRAAHLLSEPALISRSESDLASIPLEVATPPPRR
jgi:hypothetical protein